MAERAAPPVYPGLEEATLADKASNNSDNSDDSGVVDWKDPKSVLERNRHMLVSQMSCDVMFVVGEKKERQGAHKYVLSSRSDVFRHMFAGPEGIKTEFEVPDISGDHFWEMLRHIYCEEQKLQVMNVVGIMYAADHYDLIDLKRACKKFLQANLEIENACYLLMEVRNYGYPEEEKEIIAYIRKNAEDVFKTVGMGQLSRELLNELLTLPGLDVDEKTKKEVTDSWAKNHCEELKREVSIENVMDSLQDCLYVYRDDSASHRYVMDSVTTRSIFEEPEEPVTPPTPEPVSNGVDETDGMSTVSSTSSMRSRSSVHTYSRLPSCNMWPDLEQVTRLQEVHGSDQNDAMMADAFSFTVDQNIYLFGFSIYGPKKEAEGKYQIDTILSRKKKDVVMETINIKGAGIILPVMFERPVKVDKGLPYTLEIYIKGPSSHMGSSGQSKIQHGPILFTFSDAAKVKRNRSNVSKGQIPRLYFMPRNKK
ncbi:BTB/POZ domain-containing protein 6 [Aplysia californica]|uniref:BTB/POZ domain-containing protein 6 n=1 Tax=Aplysia californica TaxID=6500 RepID=A0ABM1VNU0_APLCA|nr:BTB/POZ domain-containing protein 6 [Aplysia californica]XP_005092379.1 BTB/POZ domain-containing protein 6 [Aplysia californica]XP_035824081.1 BTB/POZ domain-containing protein 6 [Aplysia californica]XP_035824082.1 BTB/POZ domain-containing protein 6 [Aplysia californica]XP_035824083.1 BTB/POZ domain-containing protein 6 [Aplysia californica]XP_035824084.1 BTB/POZ domain-containing protein 6 [Aplysia californica]XP_035824085.1 BTB/POZ domain-containing protein 6 [Aplysia californica]